MVENPIIGDEMNLNEFFNKLFLQIFIVQWEFIYLTALLRVAELI